MTPTDWLWLWALGRARGLSEGEFWALSLRELQALRERWEQDEERADRRAALIAAVMANLFRDPRSRPVQVEDFLPKHRPAARKREMSSQEMLEQVRMLNRANKGKG